MEVQNCQFYQNWRNAKELVKAPRELTLTNLRVKWESGILLIREKIYQ